MRVGFTTWLGTVWPVSSPGNLSIYVLITVRIWSLIITSQFDRGDLWQSWEEGMKVSDILGIQTRALKFHIVRYLRSSSLMLTGLSMLATGCGSLLLPFSTSTSGSTHPLYLARKPTQVEPTSGSICPSWPNFRISSSMSPGLPPWPPKRLQGAL